MADGRKDKAQARLLRAVLGKESLALDKPASSPERQKQAAAIGRFMGMTRSPERYRFLREQLVKLKAASQAEPQTRP